MDPFDAFRHYLVFGVEDTKKIKEDTSCEHHVHVQREGCEKIKHSCASSADHPVGERMGSSLDQEGARSEDPKNPSTDVGTVKIFENDRIRVWDMCVEIGGNTGFHKHEHDYIFMQIGDGMCITVLL